MEIEYPNLSSAIVEALARKTEWHTRERKEPPAATPYVPVLAGVSYNRTEHRLTSHVYRKRNGQHRSWFVGSLPPSAENERILHEQWCAKIAEIDQF